MLFILDGLDEIAAIDEGFAVEVPLQMALPGVVWLCFGRAEQGLDVTFSTERAHVLFPKGEGFPEGVPDMKVDDIGAMIEEKIGYMRKKLLRSDEEKFVNRLKEYSKGLPLYIKYVIGDILNNSITDFSAGAALSLPKSLDEYLDRMMEKFGIGKVKHMLSAMVCVLTAAEEPLTVEALAEILVRKGTINAKYDPIAVVREGLARVRGMVRTGLNPDGQLGFILYHQSLYEYMTNHNQGIVDLARDFLGDMVLNPEARQGKAGRYLLRWGVKHLIDAHRWADLETLLTDIFYPETKAESGMVIELLEDFNRLGFNKHRPIIVTPWVHEDKSGIRVPTVFPGQKYP
ncbi:MAG: hypothetical protein WA705_06080 [Candidatus Ozemobacteraceae bacterium]